LCSNRLKGLTSILTGHFLIFTVFWGAVVPPTGFDFALRLHYVALRATLSQTLGAT
jgi:hypothetical protein